MSEFDIKTSLELRDSELARRFVLEGLLFQCVLQPGPHRTHAILDWYLESAKEGFPLPPIGVVADVGHLAFGEETGSPDVTPAEEHKSPQDRQPLPSTLVRQYEDLVLGKLYGDRSFDRAVDALRRYADRRDRAKGLAFLLQQMGQRAGYHGVQLSLGVIRDLLRLDGADLLAKASESLLEHGPVGIEDIENGAGKDFGDSPPTLLEYLYRDLISHVRNVGEVLGVEDIFELEHGTAIAGSGHREALRQVVRAAAELARGVPHQPVQPLNRRQQVATQIVDEDTYPIGGFSSISNRGSIESLLHSQLAFMEPAERPDMFDIKFLRDELLYYSRDENQFLRRRRSFVFVLFSDLTAARVKGPLPYQRIILLFGLLRVVVERLTDWLSEDALLFEFVFLKPSGKNAAKAELLVDEREWLEMLFREQIANKTVEVKEQETLEDCLQIAEQRARRSLCHCVLLSTRDREAELENALLTRLRLEAALPAVSVDEGDWQVMEGNGPMECWSATLVQLLKAWIAG